MSHALVVCIVALVAAWFPAVGKMVTECNDASDCRRDATPSSAFLAVFITAAITLAAALSGWILSQELKRPECPPQAEKQ